MLECLDIESLYKIDNEIHSPILKNETTTMFSIKKTFYTLSV